MTKTMRWSLGSGDDSAVSGCHQTDDTQYDASQEKAGWLGHIAFSFVQHALSR